MTCCGTAVHTIELGGSSDLALSRCASCDGQVWRRAGSAVRRDEALRALTDAFAGSPQRRAAPPRRGPRRPRVVLPEPVPRQGLPDDRRHLLDGWTVLGR